MKKSIYVSGHDIKIWNGIPSGDRSEVIKKALRSYWEEMNKPFKPDEVIKKLNELVDLKNHYDAVAGEFESKVGDLDHEIYELKNKLRKVEKFGIGSEEYPWATFIDVKLFWKQFLESAEKHFQEDICFDSPSGRTGYRVQNIVDGKVMIERLGTRSKKPSTFTFSTIERAVRRFQKSGKDAVEVGGFMPVLAQECAVVEIHPNLRRVGSWIVYNHERNEGIL